MEVQCWLLFFIAVVSFKPYENSQRTQMNPMLENLTAVDCTLPKHEGKYSISNRQCEHEEEERKQNSETEIAIIEEREYYDVLGESCSGRHSRFQFQCWKGTFLAEQRWANIPDINVHFEIFTEECRRMHESKTFKDKRGGKHDDWNEFCQGEDVIEIGVVETKLVSMEVK